LLRIAVEHAGARRGLLIIVRNHESQIEAEARTAAGRIEVALRQAAITGKDLPESVLHYVIRTRESVILDDASIRHLFSGDDYFRWTRTKSILCLPIVKQAQLIGVLYLENNLTAGVFTSSRIAVLELLASQAAVSLEHALLYADLQRREVSLRKAQSELAHMSRLTTMGELAASIAHEVSQPVGAIANNANACLRLLSPGFENFQEMQEGLLDVLKGANRVNSIIQRMRALAKKVPPEMSRLDLKDVITDVLSLIDHELTKRQVLIRVELPEDLPPVLGDRVQLQQVMLNLLINGIEAINDLPRGERKITIRARSNEQNGRSAVLVSVQDSGVGLNLAEADRLFEAFYTTRAQGLGMGLAISLSIIEAHGGRLWVAPTDGRGATFEFLLPTTD
jgi:C4-dicarboxylate-specific signal transduction histidine kinase